MVKTKTYKQQAEQLVNDYFGKNKARKTFAKIVIEAMIKTTKKEAH